MKNLIIIVLLCPLSLLTVYGQNRCKQPFVPNSEGFLVINRSEKGINKQGLADSTGRIRVEPKYDEIYSFSNDRALIKINDKYGYLNTKGEEIIKPKYYEACSFSEGLAVVQVEGKYGYIATDGIEKIKPQFNAAFNFSDDLARVKINGLFGYIDKEGTQKIEAYFDKASDFQNGIAEVIDPIFSLDTYINKEGKIIARKGNVPSKDGMGLNEGSLLQVNIESNPEGANVYMIPLRRTETEPNITGKDENSLFEFKVSTGPTPTKFLVKKKVYVVLFVLNDKRQTAPLDVREGASNSVKVEFK